MKKHTLILILPWILFGAAHAEEPVASVTTVDAQKMDQLSLLHQKAENLVLENKFREALAIYSDIILMEPDDEVAYTRMGHIYMILGDLARAEENFLNALHINPENETARMGIQKIKDPDGFLLPQDGSASTEAILSPPALLSASMTEPESMDLSAPTITTYEQRVQTALTHAGFYQGPIDGKIGSSSRKAIEDFQTQNGLVADGIAGPKTWEKLEAYLESN